MSQISDLIRDYLTEIPQSAESVYDRFKQEYPQVGLTLEEFLAETTEFACPQVKGEGVYMKEKKGKAILDTSTSDAATLQAFQKNNKINDNNKLKL